MPSTKALILALGLQAGSALRRAATKAVAGVPIINYRYRHLQVGTADGEYDWVLKFKAGVDDEQIKNFCGGDAGQGLCHAVGHPSNGGVPLATVRATEQRLEKLLSTQASLLEWVEPDTLVELEPEIEEAEQAGEVWGHKTIGLERSGFTGHGSHIYVMDTGIRVTHEDFEGRAIPTIDTIALGGSVKECNDGDVGCAGDTRGHGTHVAGTAGGKLYGVAKKATVHAMKVCCGAGTNVLAGMDWIARKAAKPAVMTMSLGSYSTPESSRIAVDAVVASGVTVIVSAGNANYPSCQKSYTFIRSAIGVGASTPDNTRASFSNYGECNAIFAPGVYTLSASHFSDIATAVKSGTSMAAPMVAGVTAMLLEQDATRTPAKIRELLRTRGQTGQLTDLREGDPNILLWAGSGPASPTIQASIPISVGDCGGSRHIARIDDYSPKAVRTGATTVLRGTGTTKEDVTGGTLNMKIKMTGFPWTTLAEIKNANICNKITLELRALGIYGGFLEWEGFDCPVKKGTLTAQIKVTLQSYLPTALLNVRAELNGTGRSGQPLLCATVTTSGR